MWYCSFLHWVLPKWESPLEISLTGTKMKIHPSSKVGGKSGCGEGTRNENFTAGRSQQQQAAHSSQVE